MNTPPTPDKPGFLRRSANRAWRSASRMETRRGVFPVLLTGAGLSVGGFILTSTIAGAIVGIPFLFVGIIFLARGLY